MLAVFTSVRRPIFTACRSPLPMSWYSFVRPIPIARAASLMERETGSGNSRSPWRRLTVSSTGQQRIAAPEFRGNFYGYSAEFSSRIGRGPRFRPGMISRTRFKMGSRGMKKSG